MQYFKKVIMVDDRYAIYPEGDIYDTLKAKDIPEYVFNLRDLILKDLSDLILKG